MGKRESYTPGTFCWVDLATTDADGAKAFYAGLFGWEAEDTTGGDGGTYTILRLNEDDVAGLYEMEAGRRGAGVQPHWLSYVSVEDADVGANKARELGGKDFGGARDAAEMGRMATIQDTTGAMLGLWEARTFIGASRVNDPGYLTWNDLQTSDPSPAADFYAALLGWEIEPMKEDGKLVYATIKNAGLSNGGIMPSQNRGLPYWLPYFTVASSEDALAKARELGGEVLAGPLDIGAGMISVLHDPQGAVFAVYEGETDD